MTTESQAPLPRWGVITEPMTVLTNVLLAAVAFVLGARVAYAAAAEGRVASAWMGIGFLATAVAAAFGAAAHALDPRVDSLQRGRCWRGALYIMGVVSACTTASVAYFAATGSVRVAILLAAGVKLAVYIVRIARRPEFRFATMDYGASLAVLLAGLAYVAATRAHVPGASWLVAGVVVSLIAGLVQGRRVSPHRHFNHNDFYHVIQIGALYLLYRGATLLVDR
jgi:hypothetical protein